MSREQQEKFMRDWGVYMKKILLKNPESYANLITEQEIRKMPPLKLWVWCCKFMKSQWFMYEYGKWYFLQQYQNDAKKF